MQFTRRINSLKQLHIFSPDSRMKAVKLQAVLLAKNFCGRELGEVVHSAVDPFPPSLCWFHAVFAFPSASWHTKHIDRQTQVQVLPVGSPLAPSPRPTGTHCRVKGIVFSIKKQKGTKNCGLKAQGKETGILYRLLNVQFKSW